MTGTRESDVLCPLRALAALLVFMAFGSLRAEERPVLSLPVDQAAAEKEWDIRQSGRNSKLELVKDDLLGRQVYEARGTSVLESRRAVEGSWQLTAWVRFVPGGGRASATLSCGINRYEGEGAAACALQVSNGRARDPLSYVVNFSVLRGGRHMNAAIDDRPFIPREQNGTAPRSLVVRPRFDVKSISPLMDESMRRELEATVTQIPPAYAYWRRLRIINRPERLRVYHDGLLVYDAPNRIDMDGRLSLNVTNMRMAGLKLMPVAAEETAFVPVPLDDLCNAHGRLRTESLPAGAGEQAAVHGVPVQIPLGPEGNDHVDIGRSAFRYRMFHGYRPGADPSYTFRSPTEVDPLRLWLRVPKATYSRAWILAAADDSANTVPLLTVRFYKPGAGWPIDAAATVPAFTATTGTENARRVQVTGQDGKPRSLWLIPIELDAAALASDYRDQDVLNIELTKATQPHVAYPDPCNYMSYQAGLPSSVRLYGLTLEKAPVCAVGTGNNEGNLYPHPARPVWHVYLRNQRARELTADIALEVKLPYGQERKLTRQVRLAPKEEKRVVFQPPTAEYGLYEVTTSVSVGDWTQSRWGSFLRLPPDTRVAGPHNSPWGLWCWGGGHLTNPDPGENARLLKTLGAINSFPLGMAEGWLSGRRQGPYYFRRRWGVAPDHYRIVGRRIPGWCYEDPVDPAKYKEYVQQIAKTAEEQLITHPDLQYVNAFAENSISLRMTHGVPPWAFGQPWFDYTDKEAARVHALWTAAKGGIEGTKQGAPKLRFILGHCAPNFYAPFFMLDDWDKYKNDIAGFGLDMPQFERMPERQPRATEPSLLFFLHHEMKKRGLEGKELVHLESYFPSSHPLALGWRGQADSICRTAVLSMALGTTKFMDTWTLHDCGDRWGSQHYGCVGLISRFPEWNPKPAAAAFATMTQVLDVARYDGWLETGSRSAFCLRFKDDRKRRLVYAVWTIRGNRPLNLTVDGEEASVVRVDEQGNERPVVVEEGRAVVTLTPTLSWLVVRAGTIKSAEVGPPVYAAEPGPNHLLLADFDGEGFKYEAGVAYQPFAENHWDVVREVGKMESTLVASEERGTKVWRVTLKDAPADKPLVGFYGVFTPARPIVIPGKARALGIYGNGRSAWNRIVYELTDAKGERWMSCGYKDAWNCDDTHSRAYFNHDGWRYMEFPLPGSAPGDNYREKDTVWWGHNEEGVVELPLQLTRVFILMRPKMIYVNEMLPVPSLTVELDDLMAVYERREDMTEKPVQAQVAAADVMKIDADTASRLPNPITDLRKTGVGEPPRIAKVYPPEERVAGNRLFVEVAPVKGAAAYRVYVSAYASGAGAKPVGGAVKDKPNVIYLRGLRPEIPMYLFATYMNAEKKESKPSPAREVVLKDEFPFK